jgi:hypothetical protein
VLPFRLLRSERLLRVTACKSGAKADHDS